MNRADYDKTRTFGSQSGLARVESKDDASGIRIMTTHGGAELDNDGIKELTLYLLTLIFPQD